MKSAIFHSINLPFDEQVAEKILNVIYYTELLSTITVIDYIFRSSLFDIIEYVYLLFLYK